VEKTAQYGYKGIDFFFDKFLELTDEEYDRVGGTLADVVQSKGMEIASLGARYLTISTKRWKREPAVALVKKAIDFAARVGCRTVVSYISGYYNPPTYKLLPLREAKDMFVSMVGEALSKIQGG
jgi:sugar phosphate isomerase/epimerase